MQSKVLQSLSVITAVTEGCVTNGGENLGNLVETRRRKPMFDDLEISISCLPFVDGVAGGIFPKINVLVRPWHAVQAALYSSRHFELLRLRQSKLFPSGSVVRGR